ncbi:hypothetical protein EDB83DRAFT_361772 [Lactarius deliciosus]|nr:hypothetical protein EDB83DRAFT_361772 [Lactarius deliciosus]
MVECEAWSWSSIGYNGARQSHRRDQSQRRRAKTCAPVDVHGNRHRADGPHLLAPNRPSRKSPAVFQCRIYPIPACRCVDTLSYLRPIQRSRSPCALTALPNRRLPLLGTRRHAVGSCPSRRGHPGRSAVPTPAECTLPSRSSALQRKLPCPSCHLSDEQYGDPEVFACLVRCYMPPPPPIDGGVPCSAGNDYCKAFGPCALIACTNQINWVREESRVYFSIEDEGSTEARSRRVGGALPDQIGEIQKTRASSSIPWKDYWVRQVGKNVSGSSNQPQTLDGIAARQNYGKRDEHVPPHPFAQISTYASACASLGLRPPIVQ